MEKEVVFTHSMQVVYLSLSKLASSLAKIVYVCILNKIPNLILEILCYNKIMGNKSLEEV